MKKNKKLLVASCLLCATMAIGGMVAACADKEEKPTPPETTSVDTGKKNLGYAPDIFVDWGEYSLENVPNAVKDSAYQLFTATAEDVYGDALAVTTRVYLHYYEDTKNLVTISDNLVIPTTYGIYTVEYTATDEFGNVGKYIYDFACEEVETLSLNLDNYQASSLAGTKTQLADVAYANAMGNVTVKIKATHKDGKVVYDLTDKTSFVPMYAGEYNVEYACSDYNLTVKKDYTLTVGKNDVPVFLGEADMPKYFIVGKEYTLPSVEAYQFVTGNPAFITPIISVSKGKEKAQQLSGYTFTPDKECELTFTYTIACGQNKQTKTYTAQAVNIGKAGPTFDIGKYFYATDCLVSADAKAVNVATETDGASVEFINTLSANAFSVSLSTQTFTANFDAINLYLKDSADESIALKITYANPGKSDSCLSVNDGDPYDTRSSESSVQLIAYDNATRQVSFNGAVIINVPKKFKGFPSERIQFSIEFVGVTGRSEVQLYGLNNQVLKASQGDYFAPEVWFTASTQNTVQINHVVEIAEVDYIDVLDTDTKLYLNVISPTQEYVVSEAGVTLQNYTGDITSCTFRASEYGSYLIRFIAEDSSGNSKAYAYSVDVKEIVPPTVSLESKLPKTVKVGESFTVSNVIIEDDVSAPENCTVIVTLLGPIGDARLVTVGKAYSLQTKGVYYLYYTVKDEAGNTTMLKHKLIVE